MKAICLIISGFLYISYGLSQNHELSGPWFLQTVQLDDQVYERPENIESISDTYFSITENSLMITQTCRMSGGILGYFNINEEEFKITFSSFTFFQGECTEPEPLEFEETFFTFFESQLNTILDYEIIQESDNGTKLKISDVDGNFVEYINHLRLAPEEISENQWFLTDLNKGGISYTIPQNEEIPSIEGKFLNATFESNICSNNFIGYADFNQENSQVYLYDLVTTDLWCENPDNDTFRVNYLNFFFTNSEQAFTYSISDNPDGSMSLTLTSFDGDFVIYNNRHLTVNDVINPEISLYPNPVKDKLTIENPNLKITSIKVRNSSGKLVLTENISGKQSEINFSSIPAGVYFISFEQNGKILKTEKLIKK